MKHIAVLAGTYKEWVAYMGTRGRTIVIDAYAQYYLIDSPNVVLGRTFDDYRIIGTFWDRDEAVDIFCAVHLTLRKRRGTPTPRRISKMVSTNTPKMRRAYMACFRVAATGKQLWLSGVTFSRGVPHVESDKNMAATYLSASHAANALARHAARFQRPQVTPAIQGERTDAIGWWDIVEVVTTKATSERRV